MSPSRTPALLSDIADWPLFVSRTFDVDDDVARKTGRWLNSALDRIDWLSLDDRLAVIAALRSVVVPASANGASRGSFAMQVGAPETEVQVVLRHVPDPSAEIQVGNQLVLLKSRPKPQRMGCWRSRARWHGPPR